MNGQPAGNDTASMPRMSIVGTVGVPGRYGGFETLAENLVHYHASHRLPFDLAVYCTTKGALNPLPPRFETANLRYVSLDANGPQSIAYDMLSLADAARRKDDHVLILGVSGALALPLMRLFSGCRITTNIDGIEWKRAKWKGVARLILRLSEWAAVRFSHNVIADNQAIADYVRATYGADCSVIAYGGDHALDHGADASSLPQLPDHYALALCRIEPENNVHLILEAWERIVHPMAFVGNWDSSDYGRMLKRRFSDHPSITLLDPVYDPGALRAIRDKADLYVHGHSAGGTNPSLVEMMQFGIPVLAHGCEFNRFTTQGKARYFLSVDDIVGEVASFEAGEFGQIGADMKAIAQQCYTWDRIGEQYFDLLSNGAHLTAAMD